MTKGEPMHVTMYIFATEVKDGFSEFTVKEGDGAKFYTLEQARKLKLGPQDLEVLDILGKYILKT
ncbi:MAG: hypothetical protein HGA85_05605 [Nanoarchaeota archaeon]|nr:hypothetical protein [Nanoarchaeota archaeon]